MLVGAGLSEISEREGFVPHSSHGICVPCRTIAIQTEVGYLGNAVILTPSVTVPVGGGCGAKAFHFEISGKCVSGSACSKGSFPSDPWKASSTTRSS